MFGGYFKHLTFWAFFGCINVVAYLVGTDTIAGSTEEVSFKSLLKWNKTKALIISAKKQKHRKLKRPIKYKNLPDIHLGLLALSRVPRSNISFMIALGWQIKTCIMKSSIELQILYFLAGKINWPKSFFYCNCVLYMHVLTEFRCKHLFQFLWKFLVFWCQLDNCFDDTRGTSLFQ